MEGIRGRAGYVRRSYAPGVSVASPLVCYPHRNAASRRPGFQQLISAAGSWEVCVPCPLGPGPPLISQPGSWQPRSAAPVPVTHYNVTANKDDSRVPCVPPTAGFLFITQAARGSTHEPEGKMENRGSGGP